MDPLETWGEYREFPNLHPFQRAINIFKRDFYLTKNKFKKLAGQPVPYDPEDYSYYSENIFPRECDIVIVGGGAIGTSIAYWLRERIRKDFRVIVVEKDSKVQNTNNAKFWKLSQKVAYFKLSNSYKISITVQSGIDRFIRRWNPATVLFRGKHRDVFVRLRVPQERQQIPANRQWPPSGHKIPPLWIFVLGHRERCADHVGQPQTAVVLGSEERMSESWTVEG